jgi:hypothetical protein
MGLPASVVSRWNAASLNTSICKLMRVHPSVNSYGSTAESDSDSILPRAEFSLTGDTPDVHTVGNRLRVSTLVFELWHSSGTNLETALDLIETTYDNCDRAVTSPFTISGGTVTRVQYIGDRESGPIDENVYSGTLSFEVEWQKAVSVPA